MVGLIETTNRIVSALAVKDDLRSGLTSAIGASPERGADEAARVTLSAAGKAASSADYANNAGAVPDLGQAKATADDPVGPAQLTPDELKQVEQLRARDREVRAHEQAHQAAAGEFGGGATYTFQRGADGVSYAVGGEVQISMQEGRSPEETIANAQTIRAAALAPADPSPQDRSVAAAAGQMEAQARAELTQQESKAQQGAQTTAAGGEPVGLLPGASLSRGIGASAEPRQPAVQSEAAVERSRAGLAEIYGLVAANSSGFAARA